MDGTPLPDGMLGKSIIRGYALLQGTKDSLPRNVGNNLRCASCHLDDGRRANAMPYTAVYARFPQYRSRSASVQRLEDRINDCFERSMNGIALAWTDPAMRDIVAYMAFVSKGAAVGGKTDGQGVPLSAASHGDTLAGKAVYARDCARCHGDRGDGKGAFPPLWGPKSFTIGAGMARFKTFAGFIGINMPYDKPGSLTETDAANVAAYVVSRARPDFVGKEFDWPNGDPPSDAAYPTKAGRKGGR
jgi:thiosulfate dehydrogenase